MLGKRSTEKAYVFMQATYMTGIQMIHQLIRLLLKAWEDNNEKEMQLLTLSLHWTLSFSTWERTLAALQQVCVSKKKSIGAHGKIVIYVRKDDTIQQIQLVLLLSLELKLPKNHITSRSPSFSLEVRPCNSMLQEKKLIHQK